MKEKIDKIDLAKAWAIAREFANVLRENKPYIYKFEDVLPYEKNVILFSLVKILKDSDFKKLSILNNTTEEMMKENIAIMIDFLNCFIPSQEQYKEMIELKKMGEEMNDLGEELTDEQLQEFLKIIRN